MHNSLKMKPRHSLETQEQHNPLARKVVSAFRKGKILLVEDDPANLLVASILLETFGYEFDTASTGREAIRKAGQVFYAVIIMGMKMPDISGEQVTRFIRENERKLGKRPAKIICVTANALIGEDANCFAAGMDDYLSKPYKPQELQDKLSLHF